ncbi:hypothetical protein LOTGIDRAFT_202006 [Lottia gigantea]|uniref:Mediator of RNA polymerase II transcription subunit 22 n=1 Tax=Lottia gigantea TaxID=225164 RepID=V4ASF0_LOTGI|nr:hypothetical protein LOTGIDRAFT_202006 [Lottia gigantea]ESO96656.1 hypothetical protein LOTGIDRAFT_202006 [Lottia gigantea]
MAQQPQRVLPQSKDALLQSYKKHLTDDIQSMLRNFTDIMRIARVEEESQISRPTQSEQNQYEMQVRAANIVRAGESLMKLTSDIKQFLILNDFPSVNESITQNSQLYKHLQAEVDSNLMSLRDEMAADLFELEEEYYSSLYK